MPPECCECCLSDEPHAVGVFGRCLLRLAGGHQRRALFLVAAVEHALGCLELDDEVTAIALKAQAGRATTQAVGTRPAASRQNLRGHLNCLVYHVLEHWFLPKPPSSLAVFR